MKILYYFKDIQKPMDQWQRVHIFDELERHNCHITVFNPSEYNSVEEANEKLTTFIKNNKYDLFMTPYGSDELYIDTLLGVKKMGIPTLLICFDNLLIPYYHKDICKYFDLVWLTSIETENLFIKWGAKVIFNPYAANPFFFKPDFSDEISKIAFVGTPYGSRVNILNTLTSNHVDVSLFTNASPTTRNKSKQPLSLYLTNGLNLIKFPIGRKVVIGAIKQKLIGSGSLENNEHLEILPSVEFSKIGLVYSNYALSLSSTAARNTGVLTKPINVVNLRSYEIPMSGGLQICAYFEELANYFEEDKEIIFYRSNEELVEKVSFYLKPENEKLRKQMKLAARLRAENEHTWFSRFKKVFDYFGLNY